MPLYSLSLSSSHSHGQNDGTQSINDQSIDRSQVQNDEFVDGPVLEAAVRKVAADDDRDLALLQLFHRDLIGAGGK
jgi:hypothetical protein